MKRFRFQIALILCLSTLMSVDCSKSRQSVSEKEALTIAQKEIHNPENVKAIGYHLEDLATPVIEQTAENGFYSVAYTDTAKNIGIYILVSPEGLTELSYDPEVPEGGFAGKPFIQLLSQSNRDSSQAISEMDADMLASEQVFKPGMAELMGCDPHHMSNPQVHYFNGKWVMVTFDATMEKRRVYVVIRPDRTAEVVFVSGLPSGNFPDCK